MKSTLYKQLMATKPISHKVKQIGRSHTADIAKKNINAMARQRQKSRLDEEAPKIKNLRFKIENTYDEDGNIVDRDYNKFMRYVSATQEAKHKEYLKEAVLEYLRTVEDFTDAIDE